MELKKKNKNPSMHRKIHGKMKQQKTHSLPNFLKEIKEAQMHRKTNIRLWSSSKSLKKTRKHLAGSSNTQPKSLWIYYTSAQYSYGGKKLKKLTKLVLNIHDKDIKSMKMYQMELLGINKKLSGEFIYYRYLCNM